MIRATWGRGLAITGLVGVAALAVAAGPAPPPQAPPSVCEVIYFANPAPLRVRLHVTIGGRSAAAAWQEAASALFAYLDRNGDGVLDAAERAVLDSPRRNRDLAVPMPEMSETSLGQILGGKEEPLTREAFTSALRAAGLGPVRLVSTTGRADSARLSAALFRHLDGDGDGKLSAEELRAARERLAVLDANEDEWLTPDEILGRPASADAGRVFPAVQVQRSREDSPDFLLLLGDGTQAVKQILAARGGARATSLGRREFGADAATFATLDKDGNGRLDTAELAAWLRQAADVELELALLPGSLKLPHAAGSPSGFRLPQQTAAGRTRGIDFRFEAPQDSGEKAAWDAIAQAARRQFREVAKSGGHVHRKQAANRPVLGALFDFADRNADGKLEAPELEAALKVLGVLSTCSAEVTFVDDGNGLFEVLDVNGDGRLSQRELLGAAEVLRPCADAKGCVGPRDLPRRLRGRARAVGIPIVAAPAVTEPEMTRSMNVPTPAHANVPAWFALMDRNGDGDVSLREFLGPLELFRKLDRNGDGLISPQEARAGKR